MVLKAAATPLPLYLTLPLHLSLLLLLPHPSPAQRGGRKSLLALQEQSLLARGGRQMEGVGEQAREQEDNMCVEDGGGAGGAEGKGAGVDFTGCLEDPATGFCCVDMQECVSTMKKDPVLQCTHRDVKQCHYTYVTTFKPSQEEVCEENFQKICSITFQQQPYNETVRKCYTPVEKVCDGQGESECVTRLESSCVTQYVESPGSRGDFIGDTRCEARPVTLCGAGCSFQQGKEECHDKQTVSLVEKPEEQCDLNPQKTCHFRTKLVPRLVPKHECTTVPKETCLLKFTPARQSNNDTPVLVPVPVATIQARRQGCSSP